MAVAHLARLPRASRMPLTMRCPRVLAGVLVILGVLGRGAHATANVSSALPRVAVVTVQSPFRADFPGEFAAFSALSTPMDHLVAWSPAHDPEGCSEYKAPSELPGTHAVVVVRRGTCTFVHKTRLAQEAGAKGIIIVSDTDRVQVMGAGNSTLEESDVKIFAVSVQKSLGDRILTLSEAHPDEPVIMSFAVYKSPGPTLDLSEGVLICLATSLVIAGAFFSTSDLRLNSPIAPKSEEVVEVSNELAFGFCVLGSCMLMVLFYFMHYMIYFLIFGFCMGGISCIVEFGSMVLQHLYPSMRQRAIEVPVFGPVAHTELISAVPGVALAAAWFTLRNTPYGWIFQDTIAMCFLCWIQRTLRLPNIKIATCLLVAMFFFDIFWVFISPLLFQKSVMVTVATGGDTHESVPMLIRVPSIGGDPFGHDRLLGFGDIVLPGLLVSYLRRYDILSKRGVFGGYFAPSVVGYFLGLCVTIMALVIMRMGQPALLYLVPGTLGTTLVLSWTRGELGCLWQGIPCTGKGTVGRKSDEQVDAEGLTEELGLAPL